VANHAATPPHAPAPNAAPLPPLVALTWLGSPGTRAVTNGLFFITHHALGFGEVRNLLVALAMGASYTAGAWYAAPAIRALARRSPRLTTKALLLLTNILLALVSVLPAVARGAEWAFWVMAVTYLPLTGVLWPVVEAYLSGGRSGRDLRRATGAFNFAWSSAVLAAFWMMAPLLETAPLAVVAGMGGVHLVCLPIIARLPAEPPRHDDDPDLPPHPEVYGRLLPVFRVLLTLSYVLVNALEPILPARLSAMGVRAAASAGIASVWAATRVGVFVLCAYWHGWHGRWRTVGLTTALMLGGFALVSAAGTVPAVVAGLVLFGAGVGGVYVAAIYYAMAVGRAEVDAGGRHEAVIGLGYTAGPLPALAAHGAVRAGWIGEGAVTPATIAAVSVLTLAGLLIALRVGRKGHWGA